MQLRLAFLEPPNPPRPLPTGPWDEIAAPARAAALEILARLIARMLTAKPTQDAADE